MVNRTFFFHIILVTLVSLKNHSKIEEALQT